MLIKNVLILLTAVLLASVAIQTEKKTEDYKPDYYLKAERINDEAILKIAIREFENKENKTKIFLTAVSHLGDKSYYEKIQKHLEEQDLVLFEGAGSPGFTNKILKNDDDSKIQLTAETIDFIRTILLKYSEAEEKLTDSMDVLIKYFTTKNGRYGKWLEKAVKDQWGNEIKIKLDGDKFEIISLGADNKEGGKGLNTDLSDTGEIGLTPEAPGYSLQSEMATSLGLEFQLHAINYNNQKFVNSDLSSEEMRKVLKGESLNGMKNTMDKVTREKLAEDMDNLISLMKTDSMSGMIAKLVINFMGYSSKARAMIKLVLIEMMDKTKGDAGLMAGKNKRIKNMFKLLIHYRNAVVMKDLKKNLEKENPPSSISIFYGAGHMAEIEKDLVNNFNYKAVNTEWLRVFSVKKADTGLSEYHLKILNESINYQMNKMK